MIEVKKLEDGRFNVILDYENLMVLKEFYRQIALNSVELDNETSKEIKESEVGNFIDEMTKNYLAIAEVCR